MTTVLLDTNIVSYIFKRDSRAALYAPHLLHRELALSMMTVAELFQWAALHNWGQERQHRLTTHLTRYTLLPVDVVTCRYWGVIRAQRSKLGLPLASQDAWVAATALRYRLPVVTHNPDDFQQIGELTIITEIPRA